MLVKQQILFRIDGNSIVEIGISENVKNALYIVLWINMELKIL